MPMYQLGIDVSKNTLDLCLLREGIKGRIKTRKLKNTADAAKVVAEWLKKQSCELGEVHIIMEATGVYHEPLAYGLHFAGARISLANPHRTREFARGMNILTKNDKVDAWMLACYGSLKEPEAWTPPPESVRYLRALLRRRDALVADSTREKNRLEKSVFTDSPDAVRASIENMLQELSNEIEHLDVLIQEHIKTHPELNQDFRLLTSIKSVGYLLGLNMLAILKSHSFESAEQAAAFLGVVPVERRSGTSVKGKPKLPDQPAVNLHRITHGLRRGIPNRPQYGPGAGRGFQNVITVADFRQRHQAITDRGRSHKKLRFSPDFSNRRGVIQPCAHQPDTFS